MRIAVADDESAITEYISDICLSAGHSCACFGDGSALKRALARETYDLIVLDWNLPDSTGLELLQWMSATMSPKPAVIMLTSRSEAQDVVDALEAGADDYIVKPEKREIIAARIQAVGRRFRKAPASTDQQWQVDNYSFDRSSESVTVNGVDVKLTAKEFALAALLFQNIQRPLSRGYLLETIWQSSAEISTRTVDMHISRVRTKLMIKPENGFRLVTIFSYGYRLDNAGGAES